jgi:hypothetical protein
MQLCALINLDLTRATAVGRSRKFHIATFSHLNRTFALQAFASNSLQASADLQFCPQHAQHLPRVCFSLLSFSLLLRFLRLPTTVTISYPPNLPHASHIIS